MRGRAVAGQTHGIAPCGPAVGRAAQPCRNGVLLMHAQAAQKRSVGQLHRMRLVDFVPPKAARADQRADFTPAFALIAAHIHGHIARDGAHILFRKALARIEQRAVLQQNRAVRGADGRASGRAPRLAAVRTQARPAALVRLHRLIVQRADLALHPRANRAAHAPPILGQKFARIERKPGDHHALAAQRHDAHVAVVQRRIVNDMRLRPRLAAVMALAQHALAPRADVAPAQPGRARNQRAVFQTRDRRPAEIAEIAVRHTTNHTVFSIDMNAHNRFLLTFPAGAALTSASPAPHICASSPAP